MSTESGVRANVWLCGVSFKTKYEVEDYIKELEDDINRYKKQLLVLCFMTEPGKFCGKQDPDLYITNSYEDNMECLEENYYKLNRAQIILDNWDETHHANGGCLKDKSWSDYVAEVNEDGSPVHYKTEWDQREYRSTTGQDWDVKNNKPIKVLKYDQSFPKLPGICNVSDRNTSKIKMDDTNGSK